jgi:acylphosphatase
VSEAESGCIHVWVEGRVQGVGFRAYVQDCAQRLGLTGWVRNVGEDRVELWAEGPQPELDRLFELVQRGPRSSYVSGVRIEKEAPKNTYLRFQVAPSSY